MLAVRDALVVYPNGLRAVDQVDLDVAAGETVALVGESGCGKTTMARAILGLQDLAGGTIEVDGKSIIGVGAGLAERIGMVWQDPYASMDPRWRMGRSVTEPADIVGRKVEVGPLFEAVGLDPEFANRYPHELSGGQRQRAAIARALALEPPLVICDEPTAALDLSVQAQILNLLQDLKQRIGCAFLYISHDLGTVQYLADRVYVMQRGKIVEHGPTDDLFENPQADYTKKLLAAVPSLEKIGVIPGEE